MVESRFGPYAVLEPLGKGGMGSVFVARQDGLERLVALKVMASALLTAPDLVARFRREAEVASRVVHRGMARIYDYGDVDGVPYLAMELVRGPSLASVLAKGPLPPAHALAVARELLEALAACHAAGVLHRDIKPSNILTDEAGRVVLVDLGLAKPLGATALTGPDGFVGTPAYVPPEVLLGEPCTAAGDVYQVGLIVHEMIAGERLYQGGEVAPLLARIAGGPTPEIARAPGAEGELLHDFAKRCTARWPEDRYPDAAAARAALGGAGASPAARRAGSRSADRIPRASRPPRASAAPALLPHGPAHLRAGLVGALCGGALMAALVLHHATPEAPAASPRARSPAPVAAPAEDARSLVRALGAELRARLDEHLTEELCSAVREHSDNPAKMAALRSAWRERYRKLLHVPAVQSLQEWFRAARPHLFDHPEITPGELRDLRMAIEVAEDLNHEVDQAFGADWALPHVSFIGDGFGGGGRPPADLPRPLVLRFGDGGAHRGRAPLSGPGVLVAPGRAVFNVVDHEMLAVGNLFGEPSRYDFVHELHPTGGKPVREAWIGARIAGGPAADKVAIGLTADRQLRHGCEAEYLHAPGSGVHEVWARLDARRLNDPAVRLVVFFEHRGTDTIPPGITVDWLALAAR